MEIVFTEKGEYRQPTVTIINADRVVCHAMLRFLCNEAIASESDFEIMVKKK